MEVIKAAHDALRHFVEEDVFGIILQFTVERIIYIHGESAIRMLRDFQYRVPIPFEIHLRNPNMFISLMNIMIIDKTKITTLNLDHFSCIGNKEAIQLAEMLKVNKTLTTLNLIFNKIGPQGPALES